MSTDFDGTPPADPALAESFDAFVNAETLIAPTPELSPDQIIARLVDIEERVRALGHTLRRQEIEIQHTRIFVESLPTMINGLRKEIATDIATRTLAREGHRL